MTTTGTNDFTMTAAEIVEAAMRKLGALHTGATPTAAEYVDGIEALNLLLKQLMGPPNAMFPSLKKWKLKYLTLDLTATPEYSLSLKRLAFTSGGTTAIAVGDTITGATSAATAKVMSVELSSGTWAAGTAAGEFLIESQSGTFESENLDVGASTNLATIAANSTQYGPPVRIIEAMLRNSDGEDSPMTEMNLAEYMAISDKDATGTPSKFYFEGRVDSFRLFLDCTPPDTTDNVFMAVQMPIEDVDSTTDHIDAPRQYFRPLIYLLAQELALEFERPISADLKMLTAQSVALAQTFEPEDVTVFFEPNKD